MENHKHSRFRHWCARTPSFASCLLFACLATLFDTGAAAAIAQLEPVGLLCEGRTAPFGVDNPRPRLDWHLQSRDRQVRGARQSAYQILVSSSAERLAANVGDLWDSGRVNSDNTQQVEYQGVAPHSSQSLYWKVRSWDESNHASAWSAGARWVMGVLRAGDWRNAAWIGLEQGSAQSTLLRKEFRAGQDLVSAILHVSGLGQYELHVNGQRASDDLLTPGWTNYSKTVLYDTYDLTPLLRAGSNALGLMLGNGMYSVEKTSSRYNKFSGTLGGQKAIALLRLDYRDGHTEWVGSDASWQAGASAITYSNVYGGEDMDARRIQPGWDLPGFAAAGWQAARPADAPAGRLTGLSAAALPIRVHEVLKPVGEKLVRPGLFVSDLGQNAALLPRIAVRGMPGAKLRITPAELVKPSGQINDTMTHGRAYWEYTLAGTGLEEWRPAFFYRGARYLQVELIPAQPDGELPRVISLQGEVLHAAAPAAGQFRSSSALYDRVYQLIRWAQRSNMMSVLTDCPHREKLGWLEQDYLNGPALRYNFGLNPVFAKLVNDIADAQEPSGMVPNIAPEYVVFPSNLPVQFRESAEWGSTLIQVPWQQYLYTGDLMPVRAHYDAMKRYVAYLGSRLDAKGLLHIPGALGDWFDIGPKKPGAAQLTAPDLSATAVFYDNLVIMARFADLLDKPNDARSFRSRALQLKANFKQAYYNAGKHYFGTGSQTANAMALALGLADEQTANGALDTIAADVSASGLTAGDVGYRYLLRALADGGRSDLIHAMNHQTEHPGYGYQLARGATSLAEAWNAEERSSQNHFMLGQINEWFFHDLAGIQPDVEHPGFKHIIIRPAVVAGLDFVEASHESANGTIRSAWRREGTGLVLEIEIPPNTTAQVMLPASDRASISESGRALSQARSVRLTSWPDGIASIAVQSGRYSFTITPRGP